MSQEFRRYKGYVKEVAEITALVAFTFSNDIDMNDVEPEECMRTIVDIAIGFYRSHKHDIEDGKRKWKSYGAYIQHIRKWTINIMDK